MRWIFACLLAVLLAATTSSAEAKKDKKPMATVKYVPAEFDAKQFMGASCAERELAHVANVRLAEFARDYCKERVGTLYTTDKEKLLAVKAMCPSEPVKTFVCLEDALACELGNADECASSEVTKSVRREFAKYAKCRKKVVLEAQKKRVHFENVPLLLDHHCEWPDAMAEKFVQNGDDGGVVSRIDDVPVVKTEADVTTPRNDNKGLSPKGDRLMGRDIPRE